MDNTTEMLDAIKKYPDTYKLLIQYFEGINVKEAQLKDVKLQLLRPHLIKFIESQRLNFLDALIYTNYHRKVLEHKELEDKTTREIMKFHPAIAPYKLAVLPLIKKYHQEKAMEIYKQLSKNFMVNYDESGNIGKRYRRQDIMGTPFVLTVDDETLNNNTVTIRNRDTMEQIILPLDEVKDYIEEKIQF